MSDEQKEAWRVTNPPHCKHLMYKYVELVGERGRCECCGQPMWAKAGTTVVWEKRCQNCKD